MVQTARRSDAARAMDALRRIVRALRVGNAAMERGAGVSSAQLFALRQVARSPSASLSHLAEATVTTPGTISEVVGRLVERGFVCKRPAAGDRRRMELEITQSGLAVLASAPETAQERLLAGFLFLKPNRQKQLASGLDEWLRAAGLDSLPPKMFFEDEE